MGFEGEFEEKSVVIEKSELFALRIVKLARYLNDQKKEYVMAKQVLRSGTSIGANLAEAKCAMSDADFLAKNHIAFKECSETAYWLRLLCKSGYISPDYYKSIAKDCNELYRMLSSITRTLKTRLTLNGKGTK